MASNKTIISEELRMEIAKDLGVYEQVKQDGGWQNIPAGICGQVVRKVIERANAQH